jgi:hypothetical protein
MKKEDKKDAPAGKNFTLYDDPMIYFFNMMTSNSNASFINYGDVFRIKKYNLVFRNWDFTDNIQTFMVYPE